ncbi:MAG: hypothetical protein ACRED1_10210 [Limisphaerales bacterium]
MNKLHRTAPENVIVTVAAGCDEEQIRPFIASLQCFSPNASILLIVDRHNPEFERAIRARFPGCAFYLLPRSPLRDFALKRKWARSILKRIARWTGSRHLARRLLKINFLRHIVIRDVLAGLKLDHSNILLCDSRDIVFQSDPFSGQWPLLWTCEEDKCIGECGFNGPIFKRVSGETAFLKAKHSRIVCAGVIGGRADHIARYLECSSQIVENLAPRIALMDGDQGIHNYLAWLRPDLGMTVLPNGCPVAHLGHTDPNNLIIENGAARLRKKIEAPAILHQYDRHPKLVAFVQARWGAAKS